MADEEESSERLRDPVHVMLVTCCVFGTNLAAKIEQQSGVNLDFDHKTNVKVILLKYYCLF